MAQLRQRYSGLRKETREEEATQPRGNLDFAQLSKIAGNLPSVNNAGPVLQFCGSVFQHAEPIIATAVAYIQTFWAALEPYHPEDLLVAILGLCLVFLGGIYATLVASVEAVHIFGWPKIRASLSALYVEVKRARNAFERDSKLDLDRDGVPDIDQVSAQQLATRRVMVLAKAIDPNNVAMALEGLSTATVAILATLRIRFARAITLGTAIGEVLARVVGPFASQALDYFIPKDYEKWIPVLVKYGFRYAGISLSWVLVRMTTSVFSAARGSSMFITGVCGYLVRHGFVQQGVFKDGNPVLVAAWGTLAFIGWYWQVSSGFTLRFPLNFLLFPFTLLERLALAAVGTSS